MADLATLKVKVDAAEAVKVTRELGRELDRTGQEAAQTTVEAKKTGAAVTGMGTASQRAGRDVGSLRVELDRTGSEMASLERSAKTASQAMSSLKTGFAAIAGSMIVREFVAFADAAKLLEGRVKLVTKNAQELAMVQDALFASSQRVGMALGDVTELYARVALNIDALGRSQKEVIRFTELISMATQSSGASSAEAANATRQLSQALAGGILRAEEFNSVIEQTPTIARAIADGLGLTIGELRKMVVSGQVSADAIFNAILKVEDKIRKDFATAPETVSKAWERSKNDIIKSIGDLDKATNASGFFRFLARVPGAAAVALNPFYTPTGISAQGREAQGAANLAQARAMTPEGRAEAAAEAERKRQEAIAKTREAEVKAEAERRKAWEQERSRADERAKWEMEEVNRAQLLVDARLRVSSARAGFSMGAPGAAVSGLGGGPVGMGGGVGGVQGAALQQLGVTGQMAEMLRKRLKEQTDAQKAIDDQARKDRSAAETLANQQIAQNFQENMQRALGDILTQFVTDGKFSVKEIFATIKQMGGSMVGQGISTGISKGIEGIFGGTMTAMQSIMSGGVLLGLGSLFGSLAGSSERAARRQAERNAMNLARYNAINAANIRQTETMREWMSGRTAGRGGVVQSVGTVLQETTASRMIGELVAIRVATTRTADAVTSNGSAAGTVVNVTVQGGMAGDAKAVGASVAEAVDRMLGSRVQALRLTSGVAVTT